MKERTRQKKIADAKRKKIEEWAAHRKRWDNDSMRDATDSELNRMICHFEDTVLSIASRQAVGRLGL